MNALHRIRNTTGFSIAELLVAILILSMVSTVVVGGIPVARDAYNNITVAANAQVLLSTAINSLRNELGTSPDVYRVSSNEIEYISGKNGNKSLIYKSDDNPSKIMIIEYFDPDQKDDQKDTNGRELIPGILKDRLAVTCGPFSQSGDLVYIENLDVKKDGVPCGVEPISMFFRSLG